MEKEIIYFQLFLKGTDILYFEHNSVSVIINAYKMYQFPNNLELRIVSKKPDTI